MNKNEILQLEFIGVDFWDRPMYKDQNEKLWLDVEIGNNEIPSLYSSSTYALDGEPNQPINHEFIIIKPFIKNVHEFEYELLGRLKSDCDYYLGYGNRHSKHLWAGNEVDHIAKMEELWNSFSEEDKPEWLTWKQIQAYRKEMV